MKEKLKKILEFLLNPHLLLCVLIAWLITNGWSYLLFALGTYFGVYWMAAVGGAWMAFLWLPGTPEKLLTFAIAIALLRRLFPNDEKTLAVLHDLRRRLRESIARKKAERAARKSGDAEEVPPEDAEHPHDEQKRDG